MRTMFDKDVATGQLDLSGNGDDGYLSQGPLSIWNWTEVLPGIPPGECSLWYVGGSCDEAQQIAIAAGNATINQFDIVVQPQ